MPRGRTRTRVLATSAGLILLLAACGEPRPPRLDPPGDTLDLTLRWSSYRKVPGSEKPDGTGRVQAHRDWRLRCTPGGTFAYACRLCEAPRDAAWRSLLTGRWEHEEDVGWLLLPDKGPSSFLVEQTGKMKAFALTWAYVSLGVENLENGAPYWTVPLVNLDSGELENSWTWVPDPRLSR